MDYNISPLVNLMVTLTNQCTMRCPFCFVEKEHKRMTLDTLRAVTDFVISNAEASKKTPRLCYFGGEPMMEWDTLIVPITDYIRREYQKPFVLSMTTNMTLLNEERIRYIVDNSIHCLFSIDGGEQTMGVNRPMADGSSGFALVDRNAALVTAMIPNAAARITLSNATVDHFFEDVLYVEDKGFASISVLPDLFTPWTAEQTRTMGEQITRYGDYLIESFRNGKTPTVFQQYSEMFYKMMLSNTCIRENRPQSLLKCTSCGKCGFGLEGHATTDHAGNIFGCLHPAPLTTDSPFYLGDVFHGVDPERSKRLVELCDAETPGGLDCERCRLAAVCDRGCAPNNYIITGRMTTPPEPFCHFYRFLMEDALRVAKILGKEENEGFRAFFQARVRSG